MQQSTFQWKIKVLKKVNKIQTRFFPNQTIFYLNFSLKLLGIRPFLCHESDGLFTSSSIFLDSHTTNTSSPLGYRDQVLKNKYHLFFS